MTDQHFMIDIETLDTCDTALILSIAIVRFSELDGIHDSAVFYPDFEGQRVEKRTISIDTISWWLQQEEKVCKMMDIARKNSHFIYHQIAYFLSKGGKEFQIWAKDPSFDLDILKNFFHRHDPLWKYSQERSVRTAYAKLKQKGIEIKKPEKAHDALSDAITQAENVISYLLI